VESESSPNRLLTVASMSEIRTPLARVLGCLPGTRKAIRIGCVSVEPWPPTKGVKVASIGRLTPRLAIIPE